MISCGHHILSCHTQEIANFIEQVVHPLYVTHFETGFSLTDSSIFFKQEVCLVVWVVTPYCNLVGRLMTFEKRIPS